MHLGGFPKIRGTIFGSPYSEDHNVVGLYWGPTTLGN